MELTGLTLRNARTGMLAQVLEADEQDGRRFVLEYTLPPVAAPR